MFGAQLPRRPAYGFSKLFRDPADLHPRHLCKHVHLAVALDELNWNIETQQTIDCFQRHRTGHHIAADHDLIYVGLTNILEDSLERGKIAVNIVDRSDAHRISNQKSEIRNPAYS